jgi:hypothetical protein
MAKDPHNKRESEIKQRNDTPSVLALLMVVMTMCFLIWVLATVPA